MIIPVCLCRIGGCSQADRLPSASPGKEGRANPPRFSPPPPPPPPPPATVFIALELGRRVPNLDVAEHARACLWEPEDGSAKRAHRLRVRRLRTVWRRPADLPSRH
jgi:hypothetical protein